MKHAKHIIRALLLIFLLVTVFEIILQVLRPESFGELGHYRADALKEIQAQPITFGEVTQCATCHAEQVDTVSQTKHGTINCQMCHGALTLHASKGEKIADMPIDRSAGLCLRCHEYLPSRPVSHKQIVLSQHIKEQEIEDLEEPGVCINCHAPHEPDL